MDGTLRYLASWLSDLPTTLDLLRSRTPGGGVQVNAETFGRRTRQILSVLAIVVTGCGAGAPVQRSEGLTIDPLDRGCMQAADCVIVGTTCSACECGSAVNRAHRVSYEVKLV